MDLWFVAYGARVQINK